MTQERQHTVEPEQLLELLAVVLGQLCAEPLDGRTEGGPGLSQLAAALTDAVAGVAH